MAGEVTYGANIKVVQIGTEIHEILAKYIQDADGNPKTWADILAAAAEAGISLVSLASLPTANAESYALYRKSLVFVPSSNPGTQNIKDEYIIQRTGTEGSYSYSWEQIGSTELDLSGYVQKGVTYTAAALSNGSHTHTVTVPTVSVDKTKKLGATATAPTVTLSKSEVVSSVTGQPEKYVVVSNMYGVQSTTTTASKATAGTAIAIPQKTFSDVNATNIATPSVVTVKQVNTVTNGTAASFTQGSKAAWSASVDSAGVLSFSFTANGNDTFVANTPTAVSTTNVTGVVKSGASTPSATAVTASKAANGTDINVPQYSFTDVTVPIKNADATTYATGDIVTIPQPGQTTAGTVFGGLMVIKEEVVTDVAVSAPEIAITEDTTNTGPVNEHVTTSTASATTSSDGAHTHNINVSE